MSSATQAAAADRNAVMRLWERGRRIDPRYLIAFLITLVLVAGRPEDQHPHDQQG